MSGLVMVRYNTLLTTFLYFEGSSNEGAVNSEKAYLEFMGVVQSLLPKYLQSVRRSSAYFLWQSCKPLVFFATSMPKTYLRTPRFFIVNFSCKKDFMLWMSDKLVPVGIMPST